MAIAHQSAMEGTRERIPAVMSAAVYRGIDDVRLETVPVPAIGPGEILVHVHTCGICGTDLKKISTGSHPPPRIFGHETSGVVAAIGRGVDRFAVGDRVMRALLAKEADRAREFYAAGETLIPLVDEDSQPALWVLITIYRRLLERIAARQYDVFAERIRLSVFEKLTILAKGFLKRLS